MPNPAPLKDQLAALAAAGETQRLAAAQSAPTTQPAAPVAPSTIVTIDNRGLPISTGR